MKILVYFRTGKLCFAIDTEKPNIYIGKWTADEVDRICQTWARNGFVVALSK